MERRLVLNAHSPQTGARSAGRGKETALLLLFLAVFFFPLLDASKTLFPADTLYFFPPWSELKPAEWRHSQNPLIGRDQSFQILPYREAVAEAFSRGELPLWNSRAMLGTPLLANGSSAALYPLTWLLSLCPLWLALNLQAVIKLFVAGWFACRWMKLFSREPAPAVFAAVGAMFCSFNMVWLNHPQSNVSVLLPAAYYYTEKLVRRPRWENVLGLLVVVFLQLLGGHMKTALLCAVGTGLYLLVRLVLMNRQDQNAGVAVRILRFGWAYFLGTLLAAVQVLPFLEFIRHSYTLPHLASAAADALPAHYLLLLLNPNLLGHPAAGINWGGLNFNEGAIYTGVTVLFVALAVLPAGRRSLREAVGDFPKRPTALALCAVNGFLLLWIFGPLAGVADRLPLLGWTDPARLVMVFQLNAVFAAALSFALLMEGGVAPPSRKRPAVVAVLLTFCLAGIFISPIRWRDHADYLLFHLVCFAGLLVVLVALFAVFRRGGEGRGIFSWGLCLVLFVDLFLAYGDYNPVVDKRWLSHPLPPALRKIHGTPFRVTGLDAQLPPNTAMLAGLGDVSGLGNPIDLRAHRFLTTLFPSLDAGRGMRNIVSLTTAREAAALNWLSVKYILSSKEPRDANGKLPSGWDKIYASDQVLIYENRGVLPRARVVARYEKLAAERILSRMRDTPGDLTDTVFLEEDLPEAQRRGLETAAGAPPESSVHILEYGDNRVLIEAVTAGPGLLVLADPDFPGWQARVNGQPRPIHRANYLFRAVYLKKGRHTVEFRYRPDSVHWGIFISCLALAKILIVTFWRRKTREDR
ncbi:MAG: YfhO family protein [Nitrospinales bacterium]